MKDLIEVLQTIDKANDRYRTQKLSLPIEQSEILRDLAVSFKDLTDHKIEYGNRWLDAYNKATGTNAAKERQADNEVREYELVKENMRAVSNLIDSLRSTISSSKNN